MEFAEGDKVWLSSHNLRLPGNLSRKFAAKWCGPYNVLQKASKVAYRLELPPELRGVHPTFHMSMLKPHLGEVPTVRSPVFVEGELEYEVEAVLDSRQARRGREFLVHWKGYGDFDRTWEPESNLENAKEKLNDYLQSVGRDKRR
jgi:hypothetical protein